MYYHELYCSLHTLDKWKISKTFFYRKYSWFCLHSAYFIQSYFRFRVLGNISTFLFNLIFQQKIAGLQIIGCQFLHYRMCIPSFSAVILVEGHFIWIWGKAKGLTPPAKKQISFLRCLITASSSKCHQTAIKQQAPWTKTQWCITHLIRCTLFWKGHYS